MTSNYVIWESAAVDGACSLDGMTGFDDDWKLIRGVPVDGRLPAGTRMKMDPDSPRAIRLVDNLENIDMLLVVSLRLRDLIESRQPAEVEYLPVPIYNHKKRLVDEPYYVVHPVRPVDCLDVPACKPEWDLLAENEIDFVKRLVVDEERIPADRLLFRPRQFCRVVLVHRRLAEEIDAAGMTGVRWVEIADYPER